MRTILLTLGLAGLVLAAACEKKKAPTEEAAPAAPAESAAAPPEGAAAPEAAAPKEAMPEAAAPEAAAPKEGGEAAPTMANKMAHCPSAVPGAETAVSEAGGAVVVTVTAKEEAKVTEIQKRAEHLDKIDVAPDAKVEHTGTGTGGGRLGKCPVVMAKVAVSVEKQKDGVKVTLTPKDGQAVSELASEARRRASAIADGAQ